MTPTVNLRVWTFQAMAEPFASGTAFEAVLAYQRTEVSPLSDVPGPPGAGSDGQSGPRSGAHSHFGFEPSAGGMKPGGAFLTLPSEKGLDNTVGFPKGVTEN